MANKFVAIIGTKCFYAPVGTTDPASGSWVQLTGVKDAPGIPGGEAYEEVENTRLDQVNGDGSSDPIKKHEPTFQDPGHLEVVFGDDEDLLATLNGMKGQHYAFKLLFKSGGSQVVSDGWVKGVKTGNAGGEYTIALKVRPIVDPVFYPAA